jgi:hypothetical protein
MVEPVAEIPFRICRSLMRCYGCNIHTLLFVNVVHSLLLNTEYNAMLIMDGQHIFTFTDNVLNIFLSYRKWLLHST